MTASPNLVSSSRPSVQNVLLYSAADIAQLAHVSKVLVFRLCNAGAMPPWLELDGRRYWDKAGAAEAITRIVRVKRSQQRPAGRKIA